MGFARALESLVRRRRPRPLPEPPSEADRLQAAAVVDLALRTAELALASGAVTSEVTALALTVCNAYGLSADIDATWSQVTISYYRPGAAELITGFRTVRQRVTDHTLLTRLMRFIDDVGEQKLTLGQATQRLTEIRATTYAYRGWVLCLGQVLVGVGVSGLLGGRPFEMFLAGVANALLFVVQLLLSRTQLSVFFIQAFGAAVPTAMALWIMQVREGESSIFYEVSPALVVASGIVSLLAGVGFVAAARDAMEGNLLTAAARVFDAVLQTSGIVVGVLVTLWLGFELGVQGYIAPTAGYASPSAWQVLWASLVGVGAALGYQLGMRALPFAAGLAAVGFFVYQWSLPVIGNWPGAAGVGALVVGMLAQVIMGRWRIPLISMVTTGVVAMMPGSALYRGLYEAIRSFDQPLSVEAQSNLGSATMVALALAAGSALGSQIARPLGLPGSALYRAAAQRIGKRSARKTTGTESGQF